MKIVAILTHKKSTKNTEVYEDMKGGAPVPSLYIRKERLPQDYPNNILITIEENPE